MFKEKTIGATEFKSKCLAILDELGPGGIVVTKHGRPIAKVLPISPHGTEKFIGSMKGKIKINGDLFSTGISCAASPFFRSPSRSLA
jgi:prevent-host-death family protein